MAKMTRRTALKAIGTAVAAPLVPAVARIEPVRRQLVGITPKQAEFRQSNALVRGFCAGRGAGKTSVGALDILMRAKDGEPGMCVSPTFPVLYESAWPTFELLARQLGVWIKGVRSPIPTVHFRTQDGGVAHLTFRTGEKPEALRGASKAWLWFDEASLMHHDVYLYCKPVLRYKGRMGPLMLTFTPKGRRHWTYDVFYWQSEEPPDLFDDEHEYIPSDVPKEGTSLITATTLDNPFLPPDYYQSIRGDYTELLAQQELGGKFVNLQGLLFLAENFKWADAIPADADRVRYWDKAATEQKGAYTAGLLMARTKDGRYFIEDVVRGQWSADKRNEIMYETARKDKDRYGGRVLIYIEQEGGSGGKESMNISLRELAEFPVRRDVVSQQKQFRTVGVEKVPGKAKIVRAQPVAAAVEAGNVYILRRRNWTQDFLSEVVAFPEYAYCDSIDAMSGAYNKLTLLYNRPGAVPSRHLVEHIDPTERYGVQLDRVNTRNGHRVDGMGVRR